MDVANQNRKTYEYDVYVASCPEYDGKLAIEISKFIEAENSKPSEKKELKVSIGNQPTMSENLKEALEESKWILLILSKSALENDQFTLETMSFLTQLVTEQSIKIIPVLKDVSEAHIPYHLRWIMYIQVDQNNPSGYLQRINSAVRGKY